VANKNFPVLPLRCPSVDKTNLSNIVAFSFQLDTRMPFHRIAVLRG
jgi:hypothetical protein